MKRNYGIDLLRMILMIMVLILHILWSGGILNAAHPLSANYNIAWLLETMAYCAVDGYIIITGYVHVDRKIKISSYILLWLQVVTYSVGISACMWVFKPESFSFRSLFYFLSPVSHNLFWFFSAYTGLFVLMPILNAAMKSISQNQARYYLCVILVILSGISIVSYSDPFMLKNGYSVIWFVVLYMVGACIKQFNWDQNIKRSHAFFIYLLCVVVSWVVKMVGDWYSQMMGEPIQQSGVLISYISPTILLSAVSLFCVFSNLNLNAPIQKFVGIFSPATFGVYLIHTHECLGVHLIQQKYAFLADQNSFVMVGGIILVVLAIFLVCLLIDWVRLRIFGVFHIKRQLERIEKTMDLFFVARE